MNKLSKKIDLDNLLFAFGIIFTIITGLRLSNLPVGLGEVLLILWISRTWIKKIRVSDVLISKSTQPIIIFWLVFFLLQVIGMSVSLLMRNEITTNALHDIIAYLFSSILCLTLCINHTNHEKSLELKMKYIIILGISLFFFLSLWSQYINNSILGLNLTYGSIRFTGGALNPNQLAIFLVPIPCVTLYFIGSEKYFKNRVPWLVMFILSIYLGYLTDSDAIYATWVITLALLTFKYIYSTIPSYIYVIVSMTILSVILIMFIINNHYFNSLIDVSINRFNNLDEDGSRFTLWILGIRTGLESKMLGFGPGPHVINYSAIGRAEVHNTYLDVFTQIGILGLILFILLLLKTYKNSKRSVLLSLSFISLLVFITGHFTLRQPVFWFFMMFFLIEGEP